MSDIFQQHKIFGGSSNGNEPEIKKINTDDVEMRQINWETAYQVIVDNHYSHTAPTSRLNFGFYIDGELSTVIMYSNGANFRAAAGIMSGGRQKDMLELVRLFSYDWAPKNIESYCIGQTFKWLEKNTDVKFLLSYADLNQGHIGIIYQATNWIYTGLGANKKQGLVDDKPMHAKSIYALVGNNRRKDVEAYFNKHGKEFKEVVIKPKARYIYILGNKRQKKEYLKRLKLPVYSEYPKSYEDAVRLEDKMREKKNEY